MSIAPPPSLNLFEDWAEDTFQQSGTGTGVTINSPKRDRRGWDFIAEWDEPAAPHLPADTQTLARTARIQVKSCRKPKPVARLKLSNALRFAAAVDPCFVLVYWLNRARSGVEVYARHFDDDLIERALKRAREAYRDGEAELHKITLLITMSDHDLHTGDHISWIQQVCSADPAEYAERKAKTYKNVGYGEGAVFGVVNFNSEGAAALVEHALGLRPEFNPDWVELKKTRFGIPEKLPISAGKPADFKIEVAPQPSSIVFEGLDGRVVAFDGQARMFHLPGSDPAILLGVFESPFLTARLYKDGRIDLEYDLPINRVTDIKELRQHVRFFAIMSEGQAAAVITIGDVELPLEIMPGDKIENHKFFIWADAALQELGRVAEHSVQPRISVADIGNAGSQIQHFLTCTAKAAGFSSLADQWPAMFTGVTAFWGYAYVQVGKYVFVDVFSRDVTWQEIIDRRMNVRLGSATILESWAQKGTVAALKPKIRRRFAQLRKQAQSGTVFPNDGDMTSAVSGPILFTIEL